jgi:hypothetical protein
VNVYTWLDAARAALEETAREEPAFRRAVDDAELSDDLLGLVQERLDSASIARRKREKFVSSRQPIRPDRFEQLRALRELDAETVLERRPTVIFDLSESEDRVTLAFEGRRVSFPAHAREALEAAAAAEGGFTASELPGRLDADGRIVLVRALVREGFLQIRPDDW